MSKRAKLAALSAAIWSVAVVIVFVVLFGTWFKDFDRQIDALVKAIGGRV